MSRVRYRRTGRQPSLRQVLFLGWNLVLWDFRNRYRQAYLGYLWTLARLLAPVLPLILVGNAFDFGGEDMDAVEYALFALAGFLMWQVFWDSVSRPQWIARRLRSTFRESPIRPAALVAAGAGLVLINTTVYAVIFAVVCAATRTLPPPTLPLALAAFPGIVIAGLAIGAFFIPLTYVYLDFRYGLPFLSSMLLWTAPVLYVTPEEGLLAVVNRWNPLTYLINIPRQWLVEGMTGDDLLFPVSAVAFAVLYLAAMRFLRRAMPMAVQALP